MQLTVDSDIMLYKSSSVAEERYCHVTHIPTGEEFEFKNKTTFKGTKKKEVGGWLKEQIDLGKEYKLEDFVMEDKQRLKPVLIDENSFPKRTMQPLEFAKLVFKNYITSFKSKAGFVEGVDKLVMYSGSGTSWREAYSHSKKYKGNRDDAIRPLLLDKLRDWAVKEYGLIVIKDGKEADDMCAIDSYQGYEKWKKSRSNKDKVIAVSADKDAYGVQSFLLNPDNDDGVIEIKGLGELYLNEKGEVKGKGEKWLYWQILAGDTADNYKLNEQSDKSFGDKSAYEALVDCSSYKECWQAMVDVAKSLYPEPKTFTSWRGETLTWNYLDFLQEQFTMARMLRNEEELNNLPQVRNILTKLGIEYEEQECQSQTEN